MPTSRFKGTLALVQPERPDRTFRIWCLLLPFTFESSRGPITARAGFHTDGASVPRFAWWFMPPLGEALAAAIPHDVCCACLNRGRPHPAAPTRPIADGIFHEALIASGVARWRAWVLWAAVRAYGRLVADHRQPKLKQLRGLALRQPGPLSTRSSSARQLRAS